MLPAGNRPILESVLETLVEAGVSELVIVVGYKRDRVQEYFGPAFEGVPISYVVQDKQLGSGHAVLEARDAVEGAVLVVNGDRVIEPSMITAVADRHQRTGEPTLALLEHPRAHAYGAVRLEGDRVVELVEKPSEGAYSLINAGIYAFDEILFDRLEATPRTDGELGLTEALAAHIEAGHPLEGVVTQGLWADATYPWDLLVLSRAILDDGGVSSPGDGEGVHVAPSAKVHGAAVLEGPTVVGPDCEVGPGAALGPNVALGRNVTVGANVTLVNSLLDADCRVGPGSTLIDCIAGQDVSLGPGATVVGGPAEVTLDGRVFTDEDIGAVFGDRVRVGGGVTAEPGALVGPDCTIESGVVVGGSIRRGTRVGR
jgi:glucose-1-phosphate thymidylyltransferase